MVGSQCTRRRDEQRRDAVLRGPSAHRSGSEFEARRERAVRKCLSSGPLLVSLSLSSHYCTDAPGWHTFWAAKKDVRSTTIRIISEDGQQVEQHKTLSLLPFRHQLLSRSPFHQSHLGCCQADIMSSTSIHQGNDGWLQSTVQSLGSHAQTSTSAYSLAALFALSTPFGFASPAQAAAEAAHKLQRQQQLAAATASASSHTSSSLVARLIANAQTQRAVSASTKVSVRPVPPFWQLAFFSAAFATGGYMIDQQDSLNGSGVITAWSITYLLFKTVPSVKQLPTSPLALALSTAVATLGLGVHGSYYFDKTSWKGAIPALTRADEHKGRLVSFDSPGSTSDAQAPVNIFMRTASSLSSSSPSSAGTSSAKAARREHLQPGSNGHRPTNNDDARAAAFHHRQGSATLVS